MKKQTRKPRVQKALPAPEGMNVPAVIDIDPQALMTTAIQHGQIDMLNKLLDVRDRLRKEQAELSFRQAMSDFQAECPTIKKNKKVFQVDKTTGKPTSKVRYSYAPIEDMMKPIKPILQKFGFSYKIDTEVTTDNPGKGLRADVLVNHVMGHTEKTSFWVPFDAEAHMTDVQKWGDTQSYASRYAIKNALGLILEGDDKDGNPDPAELKAEAEAKKANEAKMQALPQYIKDGIILMGWGKATAFQFCFDRDFDHDQIRKDLDRMADKQ